MENSDQKPVKYTILVVEDDPVSTEFIKEVFEDFEIGLIIAESGEEAISLMEDNKEISLVLMDIRLPGKDGYETTKIIKNINKNVPIIAQTAYALQGDHEKAIQLGCDDYISKPIRPSILLEKVKKYINF